MSDQKRTNEPDWEDLRYFLALARHGSLSAAARALKVSHATVARRLASLEADLGAALFERRTEGYVPTEAGRQALDEAQAMEAGAQALRRRLDDGAPSDGVVRLAVARSLADTFLAPRLARLLLDAPGLEVELLTDAGPPGLARPEADLALRLGRPADSELIGTRLASVGYNFYATPAWRERLAGGAAPVFIGFDQDSDAVAEARWMARVLAGRRFALRSDSQAAQAAAARAGLGVCLLPHYLSAGLEPVGAVITDEAPPARDLWLLMRPELARTPPVRRAADFLIALFRQEQAWLSGA